MDVDLSTDLRGLLPLVAPLLTGHSDVAIGSRLAPAPGSPRPEARADLARSYNKILRTALRVRFTDAQCGFKAVRRDVARAPAPRGAATTAGSSTPSCWSSPSGAGCASTRCPCDWVDDPDSRVDIVRTAIEDLHGVARLMAAGAGRAVRGGRRRRTAGLRAAVRADAERHRRGRRERARAGADRGRQHRREPTAHLRRARPARTLVRHHVRGAVVFVLTLALTSGALRVLHGIDATPPRAVELAVLVVARIAATVTRYVALRTWVFRAGALPSPSPRPRHS